MMRPVSKLNTFHYYVMYNHTYIHMVNVTLTLYYNIVDGQYNDDISMKVSEIATPPHQHLATTESQEDEEFSAEIEDIDEENIGDVRRQVRCFWDHTK